ncbi:MULTISPECIES: MazG nucleotide pyrophosphohydrolase domain-containing protein [unclassified Streptomyces]|uniref:MazG nucleotide pyrophosphohydrolase domain-containing protein n=1 Tax=unclassified Streptomyces TaxID=2593676 RepID=UPI0038133213
MHASSPSSSSSAPDATPASPVTSVSPAGLVRAFHTAFGLDVRSAPAEISPAHAAHRQDLLAEEVAEVAEASAEGSLPHLAHELADVVYIAYGTALVHGIDLDAVIAEVHRANMSKLGPDGRPALRADGKVLKGEHYRAPDVAGVLRAQGWTPPGA